MKPISQHAIVPILASAFLLMGAKGPLATPVKQQIKWCSGDLDSSSGLREVVESKAPLNPIQDSSNPSFFTDNAVYVSTLQLKKNNLSFIAYLQGAEFCGSGGCTALVLSREPKSGKFIRDARISGVRLPILALRSIHNGVRDLAYLESGGGIIKSRWAVTKFNGQRYIKFASRPRSTNLKSSKELRSLQGDFCRLR